MAPLVSVAHLEWSGAEIISVCVVQAPYGSLLVLTADGGLHGVDIAEGVVRPLCNVALPAFNPDEDGSHFGRGGLQLLASTNGRFAAIVVDFGSAGLLVSTTDGAVIMPLDGGDYYADTVPFSAAFAHIDGKDILIHRTEWNRLEATDVASGALLTKRYIASFESGQPTPAHYLNYFHGRLHLSPKGSRIFDDGWVWSPVAVGRIWSMQDWLYQNPWASEDSVVISLRDDWNVPACWVDEDRVALWGLGEWDEEEFAEINRGPGITIFNLGVGPESRVQVITTELEGTEVLELFSDGIHFFVATQNGTTVWDIASGSRVASFDDFVARLHDQARGKLITFGAKNLMELALPQSLQEIELA